MSHFESNQQWCHAWLPMVWNPCAHQWHPVGNWVLDHWNQWHLMGNMPWQGNKPLQPIPIQLSQCQSNSPCSLQSSRPQSRSKPKHYKEVGDRLYRDELTPKPEVKDNKLINHVNDLTGLVQTEYPDCLAN